MTRADLELALEWAALEGWNPGLHDADCFFNTDPRGFFMGFLSEAKSLRSPTAAGRRGIEGEPISSASVVAYNNKYGFVGFYIVKPKYRGQGYGIKIWQHAMKYAGSRNLGLDGIADQQPKYIKSGFKSAYCDITHKGFSKKYPSDSRLLDLRRIDFQQILEYDRSCFPVVRSKFLKCWINGPERTSLGYMENTQLRGFGVIRKCRSWYKIGPLFADSLSVAEALFQGLSSSVEKGSEIGMDIPEVNNKALDFAAEHNLSEAFRLGRMYTQTPPNIDLQKIFSVTSYELG